MTGQGSDGRDKGEHFDEAEPDVVMRDEPAEELALADDREALPWLESDDYEDEQAGAGLGQMALFGLGGLAVIALLLSGLWYWSNRPNPDLAADGSTIAAPAGPLKERPEDPGGKEFAGTGDVAPAVGEGQTREGRLATETVPRPTLDAPGSRAPDASQAGGVGIQVGAYSSREAAERGWQTLNRQTDALSGVRHRVMEGQIDSGTVYRLQAVAGDGAAARALCGTLRDQGIACQVKD
ncbi:SPOR domain-containing protein [Leptolyngbya sp. 15MV]|nr:SPOR domain-containing protein [Leptolyngbya sp. 15MV]